MLKVYSTKKSFISFRSKFCDSTKTKLTKTNQRIHIHIRQLVSHIASFAAGIYGRMCFCCVCFFASYLVRKQRHSFCLVLPLEDAGTYFPSVKLDPGRYLQPCSDNVKSWLRSMKNAGKVLLLITSSHSDYCRLICEHILG